MAFYLHDKNKGQGHGGKMVHSSRSGFAVQVSSWEVYVSTHLEVEDNRMGSVLSFPLYVGSGGWVQVIRLAPQVFGSQSYLPKF